ncbi:SMI1/KNR4 family protein [Chitinophaga nivalis]|uniref:SMI1/KNR4 family protein n=1 Tax=Chitinophaga nivalis TaxID=2991709 RepID=A0ABT3IG84_9BACT|nr:SMI1/KNR4 family protein [Chitinophaga nivalis]MCW3467339.1 SMI1/KNR4 family protein [Chitinophaga nivalis]MCW3482969.1 SMI1/KNR4 family protein [Chitinophaga nivalis]
MADNNPLQIIEQALGITLPGAYVTFLRQQQLMEEGRLMTDLVYLYGLAELAGQNTLYEVQHYLPGYLTIGDDSGGQAICLHCAATDSTVYITGHGALDTGSLQVLSDNFSDWVAQGYSLDVIRESPDILAFRQSDTWQLRAAWQALHLALKKLEAEKSKGMDLKTYLLQKRQLQQEIVTFETLHAGKKYMP